MKSIQNPFRSSVGIVSTAVVLAGSLLVVVPAHAASIVRNNTANTLNTGTAWTGGTAPGVNDIATWNSNSVGAGQTLGGSVNWAGIFVGSNTPSSGPSFTNALNASPINVTLGASGINLNNGGASNRSVSFESNVGVVLGANQIWQLSAPTSNNTGNITVASVISGSGSLTVNRPALNGLGAANTFNYLSLSGANTFNGGLTIGSNGRVLVGAGSVVTGTTINSSPLGLGTVTINGPTTLATVGTTARDLAFSSLSLAGDMTIGETTTNTGRIRFTGAMDLNNGTRAITIAKGTATGTTANTSFGFAAIDGLNATVANGTLSLQSGATGGNKSWVNFAGANVVSFTNNAGLIIGNNVSTTFNSNFAFGNNNSDKIPNLTVQSGGMLDMSDQGGNSRSVTTASLAGAGLVTNGTTGTDTATLTINGTSGTAVNNSNFSGQINDGATGKVAVLKTGSTTQILSGNNGYTGATDINSGTLVINGNTSASSLVTVASGTANDTPVATLAGNGTIGGNITLIAESSTGLTNGGVLAPTAASSGTKLSVTGTTSFGTGSIFEWDISATDPATNPGAVANSGSYGQLAGTAAISGGAAIFKIVLGAGNAFTDAFWNSDKTWNNVFTGTGATTNLASIFSSMNGSGVTFASGQGTVSGQGYFTFSGTSTLNWTAVPEPTSALAGLLITAGLFRRRRIR